jgi:pantothenate kinase type III
MAHVLAIDIGNSRISLGLFKGDSLENTISLPTDNTNEAAAQMNFLDQEIGFDLISVSSVVPEAKAA